MPQQRKRRRSTAADGAPRARKRTVATAPGGTNPVPVAQEAAPGPVVTTSAALSNNTAIVDIGGLPCCPPDAKTKIMGLLNHEEKATTRWTFPFKDGERFETAEFTQLSCYGPPANKGRYVLCSKLGEGSFSCVFKSWDTVAKDFVAMKFTLSSAGKEEFNVVNKLNMAGRMCNMGDGMNGQSIIQVKECFDSRTPRGTVVLCIVMEYVPQVLTTLLTAYNPFAAQPLGIRSLLSIAKQLMQAVMYLHDHGHVHCDIKPQNILYKSSTTEDGKIEIRLADFGSCIVDTGDCNDYIVTRPYRPPEVMLGVPLTSAADVWSCGCVIMELILGAPLFTSNDHFQLITAMVELLGVPTNMLISRCTQAETYFVRPRALTCPEAFDHPPVPHHVTVKRSRNKRSTLYYHDTESNTSSFERPQLKKDDLPNVKGQLPSFDWQMRMSSSTGNWYYANAKLGATQWQRPIRQSLRSKVEATIGPYFQVAAFTNLFSVVERMLVWDPDDRITAREAAELIA